MRRRRRTPVEEAQQEKASNDYVVRYHVPAANLCVCARARERERESARERERERERGREGGREGGRANEKDDAIAREPVCAQRAGKASVTRARKRAHKAAQ